MCILCTGLFKFSVSASFSKKKNKNIENKFYYFDNRNSFKLK